MSAGLLIACPSCGAEFALRVEPSLPAEPPTRDQREAARQQPAASSQQPGLGDGIQVNRTQEGGWEIECPNHGWHRAREFAGSGRDGPVVKCVAKGDTGQWCTVRVPLELARRRAGIGGR